MNNHLYVATESGKVLLVDLSDKSYEIVFEDPTERTMMGLVIKDRTLYLGGHFFLGSAEINGFEHSNFRVFTYYNELVHGAAFRILNRLHLESLALTYADPAFHHMNIYNDRIYATATGRNEVWEIDLSFRRKRAIPIMPHRFDFNHINNIFCDGEHYYVCLLRFVERFGYGGYVKFDRNWTEVDRQELGWEVHAFCVINGDQYNLCASAGSRQEIKHPHNAGLMVNGKLIFEHDPDVYYCKDFSMDDEHIYIVGGEVSAHNARKKANAVIFVLDKAYKVVDTIQFQGIGGFSGCRLPDLDHTNGLSINMVDAIK